MSREDQRTDNQLVAEANAGDPAAFEALYFRYRDWVARLAYRYTRNRDDALDAMQETFVYLLRKFPGFQLTASMTTFLYPTVKHIAVRLAQNRRRVIVSDEVLATAPEAASKDTPDTREDLARVMAALPESQREIVLMRFLDDLKLREIAEALDLPLGTAKSRLHKALKTLREDPLTRRYFLGDEDEIENRESKVENRK